MADPNYLVTTSNLEGVPANDDPIPAATGPAAIISAAASSSQPVYIYNVKSKKVLQVTGADFDKSGWKEVTLADKKTGTTSQVWNLSISPGVTSFLFGPHDGASLSPSKTAKGSPVRAKQSSRSGWTLTQVAGDNYAISTWMNGPDLTGAGTWGLDGSGSAPVLAKIDTSKAAQQWSFYSAK